MARLRRFQRFRSTALVETLWLTITENLAGKVVFNLLMLLFDENQTLKDKIGECQTEPCLKIIGKAAVPTRRARGNIGFIRPPVAGGVFVAGA